MNKLNELFFNLKVSNEAYKNIPVNKQNSSPSKRKVQQTPDDVKIKAIVE